MKTSDLGREFNTGETIIRQGEPGNCMYVLQAGKVEVVREDQGEEIHLTVLEKGDFFGEVPLFERRNQAGMVRATVRALDKARVITVDKKTLLRRIHEDPALAYHILQIMSRRVRELETEIVRVTNFYNKVQKIVLQKGPPLEQEQV